MSFLRSLTSAVLITVLFPCGAEESQKKLTGIIGSSITFPDPVTERGFLSLFEGKTIASVSKGVFEIEEDIYTNRLHCSSSGLFTLSHLQKNDSGVYVIDIKGNVLLKHYDLKVYEAVPAPVVSSVNVSADSCTLQCSVTHTELTTLSWFRGEQPVVSSSSEVLPLTVQLQNNTSQYKCVAQNPADIKTTVVNITTVCTYKETESDKPQGGTNALQIIIPIVLTALIIIIIILCAVGCWIKRKHSAQTQGII